MTFRETKQYHKLTENEAYRKAEKAYLGGKRDTFDGNNIFMVDGEEIKISIGSQNSDNIINQLNLLFKQATTNNNEPSTK